jgi:hypothetical protein
MLIPNLGYKRLLMRTVSRVPDVQLASPQFYLVTGADVSEHLGGEKASGHEKLFVQGRHATPFERERAEHWAWSPQWRLQGGVLVAPWRACTDARLVEKKQCPDSLSAVARASSSASDGEKREMAWKRERFVDFSGTDIILYPSDTCRLDFRALERQGVSRIPPMKMSNFSWRPLTQHFPTSFVSYGQI